MHDTERRFGGITRLYGAENAKLIRAAHACVIGVGGVGSWSVEALARTGIGRITMIDLDMIAESNVNRQIQALDGAFGEAKIFALRKRIHAINPDCTVSEIEDFVTPENVGQILSKEISVVIDAIDQVKAKAALIAACRSARMPIVVTGAAGGQIDPTRIRSDDLARTTQDPLLAKVRAQLRREYGFPRDGKKFGVSSVYSTEPIRYPDNNQSCSSANSLNCGGFGSSVCVTSAFGMVAAAIAINQHILKL